MLSTLHLWVSTSISSSTSSSLLLHLYQHLLLYCLHLLISSSTSSISSSLLLHLYQHLLFYLLLYLIISYCIFTSISSSTSSSISSYCIPNRSLHFDGFRWRKNGFTIIMCYDSVFFSPTISESNFHCWYFLNSCCLSTHKYYMKIINENNPKKSLWHSIYAQQ